MIVGSTEVTALPAHVPRVEVQLGLSLDSPEGEPK
jgi:hypothetical protein